MHAARVERASWNRTRAACAALLALCGSLTLPGGAKGEDAAASAVGLNAEENGAEADPLNVRDFGAVGDGRTDSRAAFQAALDAAAEAGGNFVRVPRGEYLISGSLHIPPNVTVSGVNRGASVLQRPAERDFVMLRLEGAHDAAIRDLSLIVVDCKPFQTRGGGIVINAGSERVLIENVSIEGFNRGIYVGHDEIDCAHLTFRNCRIARSSTWGIVLDHVHDVLIDDCQTIYNRLDGIKLRKQARNVTIRGGVSSYNGQGENHDGSGVDGYAGGDAFVIENLVTEHNSGSGIYVKTGPLFYREGFGPVRNGYISGVRSRHNAGSGIDLNRSGGDLVGEGEEKLPPLVSHVTVSGGVFEKNERSGIYLRGRNVTILGSVCRGNSQHGINLASAWDVDVIGPQVSGNGMTGISIGAHPVRGYGQHIKIRGGTIDGIDSDAIADARQPARHELEPTHSRAIRLAKGADHILIDNVTMRNWTAGPDPIRSDMSNAASLIVHYGKLDRADAVGGPGSTCVRNGRLYVKTTDVTRTDGWMPIQPATVGSSEARPESPVPGEMFFDTRRGQPLWFNGSEWVDATGTAQQ